MSAKAVSELKKPPHPRRLALDSTLERAAALVLSRWETLEARVTAGDETAWLEFHQASRALAALAPLLAPAQGALLTTEQLARRLGVTAKTVLRHKRAGALRPAVGVGKFLRWRADQVPGGTAHGTGSSLPAKDAVGYGPGRAVRP